MEVVIATRELSLNGEKVKVEILQPYLSEDGIYRCKFRIGGAPEGLTDIEIGGADSYQALALAMGSLANFVDLYNKQECNMMLRFMDENDLDFHFSTKVD